jgi:hypothetical protein
MNQILMSVSRPFVAAALSALLLGTAPPTPAQSAQGAPQGWKGTIPQGGAIEIKGVNGDISATAAAGGEVEVSAVMRGRRSDPSEVRLDIVQHGDGITICAVYPSADARPNECQPGEGGRMNVRDNDVTVAFTVRVPSGVRFIGRNVNGGVRAEALAGPVSARTVNGDVTFSTTSFGDASTVNGSIEGVMGSTQWTEPLKFRSVNGSISLSLPPDASTDLNVSTVNGDISTDFPITIGGRINPKRLTGTIGAGGRALDIETVNGGVRIRKQP